MDGQTLLDVKSLSRLKIRDNWKLVVFRSYSLGPLMTYSHISFIQLIENLYSTRLRLVKYKFQFIEFRKYDYIPFVDQVNN